VVFGEDLTPPLPPGDVRARVLRAFDGRERLEPSGHPRTRKLSRSVFIRKWRCCRSLLQSLDAMASCYDGHVFARVLQILGLLSPAAPGLVREGTALGRPHSSVVSCSLERGRSKGTSDRARVLAIWPG
jgi:hypothetical protein